MILQRRARKKAKPDGRYRSPGYRQWVRGFVCIIQGQHECDGPIEFAHVRVGTDGGMGLKPSDWWGVPLCSAGHREQHRIGEPPFERKYGVNLKTLAVRLWKHPANRHRVRHEREQS